MSLFDSLKAKAKAVVEAVTNNTTEVRIDTIPASLEELKKLSICDLTVPANVVAMTIIAYNVYTVDKEAGKEIYNFLKGPSPLSAQDISFLNDRVMANGEYLPRSYFEGATPENNYTPNEPGVIKVSLGAHSKDQYDQGYLTLFVHSGGADNDRPVTLRKKASTGEWFIFQDAGLYMGIRPAKEANPWA